MFGQCRIGISLNPIFWDFQKNKPKRHCPNKSQIERVITAKISEYREQVLELKAESKDFTAISLMEKVKNPVKLRTVGELFLSQFEHLKEQKRTGYAAFIVKIKEGDSFLENALFAVFAAIFMPFS